MRTEQRDRPIRGADAAEPPRRPEPRPLRICMVISSYHPIVGGAEKQLAQLARIMHGRGHDVRVVTRRYPGLGARETLEGIEVHRAAAVATGASASLNFLLGAVRAIRAIRPDVIHCHSLFTPSLAGLLARRLGRRPLLVKPMCGGEATSILAKRFGARRIAHMAREVDRFIAVSGEIERELVGIGVPAGKIRRIANGVDTEAFRPCRGAREKAELRARLGLPAGPLFIFAGRIAAQKRLPMLLEAWPAVRARCAEATLLIAGANRRTPTGFEADPGESGDVPGALLGQPGVRVLGHVGEMAAYLRASDVFVLPSAREGLSNALLEACSAGLAVVAARIGGAEDFVVSGENGLLFPADDRAALAEAMAALALDPALRDRLGAAAAATMRDRYDIRVTASRLLAQYAELIGAEPHLPAAGGGPA